MYIVNQKKTEIINTDFVERFLIVEKNDAVLIVLSYNNTDRPPVTLAKYPCRKDADEVLSGIFEALTSEYKSFECPEMRYFQEYHKKMDARTKRKGSS